ncbi:hypothetical protein [Aquisalibacillus elongatus]|uniref:hypothetical protein n=1 Tax=Aquisalibacillus elongatus TaxID=485577 RepID=UPI001FEBC378|nr:hypothetical protein [Aquisalibacillus elongatus]
MFPGFGQLLNGQIIKGIALVILVIIVNMKSKLNQVIFHSFNWKIEQAILIADYQWLMFFPCIYMYSLWDGFKDARGEVGFLYYFPFVVSAYFITVGLIFSSKLTVLGFLLGPVFLPLLFAIIGFIVGIGLRGVAIRMHEYYDSQ